MKSEKIYSGFEKNTRRRDCRMGRICPAGGRAFLSWRGGGAKRPGRRRQPARVPTSSQIRSIVVGRNCKAAEPPSAPAPCRSGVRGRSAPAAGGNLRAYRPAHKPNRRFGRGARTVCCADAQKDRAPEGARIPLYTTLIARILTMFAAPINPCLSELQGGRPFDRSAAFAAFAHTGRSAATLLRSSELELRPGQLEALPQTPPKAFAAFGIPPGPNGPESGRFASPYGWRRSAFSALISRLVLR